jgi:hypothetical protein
MEHEGEIRERPPCLGAEEQAELERSIRQSVQNPLDPSNDIGGQTERMKRVYHLCREVLWSFCCWGMTCRSGSGPTETCPMKGRS